MVDRWQRRPKVAAVLLLVAVSAAWGGTFVVVKGALSDTPVVEFLAWRFVLAGLVLAVLRPGALVRLDRRAWMHGIALGLCLSAGYLLQTFGLRMTTAAVSGFLTGLQVVFTPLLGWLLLRQRTSRRTWVAVMIATIGLAVISLRGFSIGAGELLTVASAAGFALQIVGTGKWVTVKDAYGLAVVQLLTVGVVTVAAAIPSGLGLPHTGSQWWAVVVTSLAATAFAFAAQSWAQTRLSASTASVVFTSEPVFAALIAWAVGAPIGPAVLVGGALVVASMLALCTGPADSRRGVGTSARVLPAGTSTRIDPAPMPAAPGPAGGEGDGSAVPALAGALAGAG